MTDNTQIELISEQLKRIQDNMDSRLKRLEIKINHNQELTSNSLTWIKIQSDDLRRELDDHELRIRSANDAVISYRSKSNIFNGGAIFTAFAALLKSFLT